MGPKDSLARIVIVGCPGLTDALKKVADRHMPRLLRERNIEYDTVKPHGDADSAAATLVDLHPDVILLGYPQLEVSAREIAEAVLPFNLCPIILVSLNGAGGGERRGTKPDGLPEFSQGDLANICRAIEGAIVERAA